MSLNPLDWLQHLFTARALEIENARLNLKIKEFELKIEKLEAQISELETHLKICNQKIRDVWPFTPNR